MRFDHHSINPQYKHIGEWSWNNEILWSKVAVSLDINECWLWQGAMSPTGALFGGRKSGHPQMSQARRFIWMSETNEDATPHRITMTCHNQQCVNPNHFKLERNLRHKRGLWSMFGEEDNE